MSIGILKITKSNGAERVTGLPAVNMTPAGVIQSGGMDWAKEYGVFTLLPWPPVQHLCAWSRRQTSGCCRNAAQGKYPHLDF